MTVQWLWNHKHFELQKAEKQGVERHLLLRSLNCSTGMKLVGRHFSSNCKQIIPTTSLLQLSFSNICTRCFVSKKSSQTFTTHTHTHTHCHPANIELSLVQSITLWMKDKNGSTSWTDSTSADLSHSLFHRAPFMLLVRHSNKVSTRSRNRPSMCLCIRDCYCLVSCCSRIIK